MQITSILVPTDFSEDSDYALSHAIVLEGLVERFSTLREISYKYHIRRAKTSILVTRTPEKKGR